jgi:hypothetical protein
MTSIGTLEVERESLHVVYDASTGAIVHVHQTLTTKGAKHPDDKEMKREALEQLARGRPDLKQKLEVLDVDPKRILAAKSLRVDVEQRTLLEA